MKIGIDISQTVYKGTGVARYTTSLLKGLFEHDKKNDYILFFSSLRQSVPEDVQKILAEKVLLKQFKFPPSVLNILWNNLHIFPIDQLTGNVDLFFSSDWTEPPIKNAKKVTTIHDLVPFKFPETSDPNIINVHKARLEWVKKESDIITCNSEFTKSDVKDVLKIEDDRLRVIYPGVEIDINEHHKAEFEKKYNLDTPYILTVGTLQPRKNIKRLIEAFNDTNIHNLKLFIVGMQGWGDEVDSTSENVEFLGYVSDDDLPFLYKNAEFFIYPALYEGFGYPVVEAMKMGVAVATSNVSSLKEIAEGAGHLFDPYSVKDISQAISTLATNKELRKELQTKGEKKTSTLFIV